MWQVRTPTPVCDVPVRRLHLANRAAGRQVEEMEPLGRYGDLGEVARIDSRVSVEARGHERQVGFRRKQDLRGRGRVHVPRDLEHLVGNDRFHVELDLDLPFGAEQLDELDAAAQPWAVTGALGGIAEVL